MVWGDNMKITIDNEEVLCDKNFTIEEEMLNTSSVILNNVYPATWEQDKDYVSRFYYPKDYSKCKIFNEIVHPTTREDVEGTNFSINVDTTKQYQVQTLKGQTSQSGTPTPSSPIPINITTGRQVVSVINKNLAEWGTTQDTSKYTYSSFTAQDISVSKTATGGSFYASFILHIPKAGTYYLKGNNSSNQQFYIYTDNLWGTLKESFSVSTTGDFTRGTTFNSAGDYVIGLYGSALGNYSVKNFMCTTISDTTYEEYKGNDYEINLGKNLFNEIYPNIVNNTTKYVSIYVGDGTFTMSSNVPLPSNDPYASLFFITGQATSGASTGGNGVYLNRPITISSTNGYVTVGYRIYGGINPEDYQTQLEKGSQATSYSPYKTPIYLGKIGTYQDYIIKTSGKNLFDISNTTSGFYNTTTGELTSSSVWSQGDYIDVSSNSQYTLSSNYTTINNSFEITEFNSNKTWISSQQISLGDGYKTITTSSNTKYIKIGFRQDRISQIQFEEGSSATLFEPYGEGQWYIHKEIGRVVLNGSEPFQSYTEGFTITESNWNNLTNNNCMSKSILLSNYYKNYTTYADFVAQSYGISLIYSVNNLYIRNTDITSVANFKTWLSSHNVEVYYVLNTPTNTLIEDEELINQLNSIELLDGLNNVSVSSPYLPFIMSLMYNYQEGYTEEDMLFCGVVENTGNISLNPRHPHYCNLQVLDFKTFLSEGETLDFVIYEKTILEAINQVIGTISDYGFVLGNVNILHSDDVIGAYSTKDKTAYDVFNYIADITQSRWTTRMVDENTVAIDFYDPSLMPQGTAIDYTQEWFCDNNIIDMSFSYSSRDYRNKQVMLSGEVYANIETTEIIVADGYQTQFNTTGKIGYVSSLLLNGNPATIITKEEYDLGYEGDFVYQPGNTYFESVNLVSTGAIITIVYFAIIEGREVVLNQEEISRVSEMIDRKGVIARYENRNDATTTQELQMIGQSYLKYKGNPEVLLKVETLNNIWNIGERVEFDSPLEELTTEYMVKKKTINYITTQDNIFYTYELSSSFNSETEINYFDNQRSKMMGNVGAGEYISRNIDIENTANVIFYDLEVNEVVIDENSTLQSELQTPLGVE
jgi:hypothetical protein